MKITSIFTACCLLVVTAADAQTLCSPANKNLRYDGRVYVDNDKAVLQWAGTAIHLNFKGTSIKADLDDERGTSFYNVIVDNQVTKVIQVDTVRKEYILAEGLSSGTHSLELFKRTEATSKSWFYGFTLNDGARILKPSNDPKRRIEFYGNSITCGNQIYDKTVEGPGGVQNNYLAYGALTARYFNAGYNCICRSGIGLMVSWFPIIMPELYDRLDANNPEVKWDFSKNTPDIVVINLGQNDWGVINRPEHKQFKTRFGNTAPGEEQIVKAYMDFMSTIRRHYPKAKIVCALGSMDVVKEGSPWPKYVEKAVEQMQDKDIFFMSFPFINSSEHPNVEQHSQMADMLIGFIEKNVTW